MQVNLASPRLRLACTRWAGGPLTLAILALLAPAPPVFAAGVTHRLRFRYEVTNPTATRVVGARLIAAVPADGAAGQRLVEVTASAPHELISDARGNRAVSVALGPLPPHGARVVTVTATVTLHPAATGPLAAPSAWLGAEPGVEIDDAAVVEVATRFGRAHDPLKRGRRIYDRVRALIGDTGYHSRDRGAAWALAHGEGDCSELAAAFVAVARASGLPSRLLSGYRVDGSGVVAPSAYHTWAELYDGATWRLADPQGGVFDRAGAVARYVATRVGAPSPDDPLSGHHRFRTTDPSLRARMVGTQ